MSEHGFEGTEKKLLVRFAANSSFPSGLRTYSAQDWQKMLDQARCTIISSTSNDRFDSYVLSESSLFVYPTMIVVKTCGTTVPLNVIPILLDYSTQLNLVVELVFYCRKNFKFPQHQPAPHTSFSEEVELLQEYFDCGSAHVLGPITDEHWNLFLADYTPRFQHYKGDNLQVLEIMMLDLDRTVMKMFYKDQNPSFVSAKQTTLTSGIADILPGSVTDERQFDPCGYSVNGLLDETYFTIHVTPEPHCSFVSFETNAPVKDYTEIIRKVLDVFKPSKFSVSVLYGSHSPIASVPRPFDEKLFGFTVNYSSSSHFAGYGAKFFNYVDEGNLVRSLEVKKRVSFPLLPRLYVPQIPELPVASVSC